MTLPTYAIAHGGGPWPWIKDAMPVDWSELERSLAAIPSEIAETPRAVLMVTAHWEADAFTVGTHPRPPMLYDYWGFPPQTYEIEYPAPNDLQIADRVIELLAGAGLPTDRDPERGFDHGTFVPAYVMYPDADVPIVQMSIRGNFDPAEHLAAGRALAPLRDEGVLIIGSGLPSYHDLSNMGPASTEPSREFDSWLTETIVGHVGVDRADRLRAWAAAPSARRAHPREEHLIPLLVAVGAADAESGVRQYHEAAMMGATVSSGYRLGSLDAAA